MKRGIDLYTLTKSFNKFYKTNKIAYENITSVKKCFSYDSLLC